MWLREIGVCGFKMDPSDAKFTYTVYSCTWHYLKALARYVNEAGRSFKFLSPHKSASALFRKKNIILRKYKENLQDFFFLKDRCLGLYYMQNIPQDFILFAIDTWALWKDSMSQLVWRYQNSLSWHKIDSSLLTLFKDISDGESTSYPAW